MDTAKIKDTGRLQTVELPNEYRFEADEVAISKVGDVVMLFPKNAGWSLFLESLNEFTPDFLESRDQPI